jgi:L-lactate dehydrogenase (cytochrome)
MEPIANVDDLRNLAKMKLPRGLFEYIDCGSYDQVTLRRNTEDFKAIQLRQRVLVGVGDRSTATTMLGEPAKLPVAISPAGLIGLLCPGGQGEIFAARAAKAAGIPFALSVMSICTLEQIRDAIGAPFWFHIYLFHDRGYVRSLLERALACGCSALILTVDWQVQAQRHRDVKNGLSMPPRITLRNFFDYAGRPRWSLNTLLRTKPRYGTLDGFAPTGSLPALLKWSGEQFDPGLNWDDVAWVRERWPGKLVIKGILDPEDARRAADAGADAISVSNHGGTQLDGAPSPISVLPSVVDAVGGRLEIFMDGGVRSGQDVLKALALGAQGCLLGRAYLYGLGAMGQEGAATAIELIRRELDISMALTGVRTIDEISRDVLWPPPMVRPQHAAAIPTAARA